MKQIKISKHHCAQGEIALLTLTNDSGASVTLSTLGAGIISIIVPDKEGRMDDVVLGYANPSDYLNDGPCAGKIPGRYANRIARGCFAIDGQEFKLAINNGPNALHGGPTGFANRIWNAEIKADNEIEFSYISADGEEGYPGRLTVRATYVWNEENTLDLTLSATTDRPTVVNLTNHAYFNLNGENAGSILEHTLWLNCHKWLPTDSSLVPTGEVTPVAGTPMDFTTAKALGHDIKVDFTALTYGKGYDNCFVIDNWQRDLMAEAAVLASAKSGRVLRVYTNQPAIQLYTGNWLADSPESVSGHHYNDYDGVALECQGYPDAPNKPTFPSQLVTPESPYLNRIIFEFGTIG